MIRLKEKNYKSSINKSGKKSYEKIKSKLSNSKLGGKVVSTRFDLQGMSLQFIGIKNLKASAKEPIIYLISSLNLPAKKVANMYPISMENRTLL